MLAGSITLTLDPLKFQRKMRNEWWGVSFCYKCRVAGFKKFYIQVSNMIGRFSSLGSYRELLNKRDFLRAAAGGLLTLASFIFESAMSAPPIVSIALALLSICINGFPIVWNAVKGLIKKEVNVDELVSIAIISSISTGEFLTAATVSFVMVIGSLIEQATSQSARKAIHALIKLSPKNATVLDQGAELVKPIEKIRVGDILLVKPGDRIPVDGVIAGGTSAVDESSITGEAMPSEKTIGDAVFSGTLSQNGVIKIKATKVGEDSTLGKVIRMVTGAEAHKPVSVRVIDKFAGWFTPAILCAAGITWAVTGQFSRAVAVLIVGCPCALILAAPTAVVATIGRAARSGILIKGGQFIEKISSATMICFDKTGTLTEGDPRVDDVITEGELNREYVLKLAAGVEQHSTHPLARAVLKAAAYAKITVRAAENMLTEIGSGIKGLIDGNVIEVGSAYLQGAAVALPVGLKASLSLIKERGATPIVVYENRQPIGIISVADHIRPQARETIQALKRMNIKRIGILSGDHEKSVRLVGDAVG